jgi:hypothetical protein
MSSIPMSLVAACFFSTLAGIASICAAPQGFREELLKIVSPKAVEPSDEMLRPAVAPETYAEYPLIILSQEKKEIARVTADESGNYRVAPPPPGDHILDVQERGRGHVRAKP